MRESRDHDSTSRTTGDPGIGARDRASFLMRWLSLGLLTGTRHVPYEVHGEIVQTCELQPDAPGWVAGS